MAAWHREEDDDDGHTHHVRLVHLDGHLADGVGRLVQHFEEAGAAKSLGAHRPG